MEIVYSKEFDFVPKLLLSKKRNPVYYKNTDKIPKKYKNVNYSFIQGILVDNNTLQKVVKNTRTVGKPRYYIINGQDLYNDKFQKIARNNLINKLHDYVKELIKDCPKLDKLENERFELHLYWYINKDYKGPDYDNLWIMEKVINDCLHKEKIGIKAIKEDNHHYMRGGYKGYRYRETEGFKIEIWKI